MKQLFAEITRTTDWNNQRPRIRLGCLLNAMNPEQTTTETHFLAACLSSNLDPISFPLNLTPKALSIFASTC